MADLKKFPVKLAVEQDNGKFYVYGSHITNFSEIIEKIEETNSLLETSNTLLVDANGHLTDINGNLIEIDGELVSLNTVEGTVADSAVTGDNPGTISAKLRGITTQNVSLLTKQDSQISVQGTTTDAAVTGDNPGTISAKLRGLTTETATVIDNQTNGTQQSKLTDGTNIVNVLKSDGTAAGQNSQLVSGSYLSVPFSTTTAQAVGSTDAGNYNWVSVHIVTQGTGSTVTWQVSDDNVNWTGTGLQNTTNSVSASSLSATGGSNFMVHGPVTGKYFRLNITGISAGTTAGTIVFSSTPKTLQSFGVSATQSGTWTFTPPVTATAPSITQVASSATTQVLKASNTARKGLFIYNGGTTNLLVKLGGTASVTSFTNKILPNGYWELPTSPIYTGTVDGIWEGSPTGPANITELT